MKFKKLHSFVVKIKEEVEKVETINENGKEVTTKSKVTESVPYSIVLKSPTRRERQDLAVFYTVKYNKGLELGMMPKAILVQKFLKDPDSPLSQDDDKNITGCYLKLESLQNDLIRLNSLDETDQNLDRKTKIYNEFLTVQKKIMDVETAYRSLFAHTTESYAQNQALHWLVLNLTFVQKGEAEPKPMFTGNTFDEKESCLFDLEDAEDELYYAALERLSMYMSLYFSGGASKPEDFEKIEKEYESQLKSKEDEDKETDDFLEETKEEVKAPEDVQSVVDGEDIVEQKA